MTEIFAWHTVFPMRAMLAFLAALAMVISPLTAAAAARGCCSPTAMTSVGAPGMSAAAPCGRASAPGKVGKSGKGRDGCAQACASAFCAGLAVLAPSVGPMVIAGATADSVVPGPSFRSYSPSGLDPPPKSIA
ncbi:MAG: hypothetical protein ACYC8V_10030 [Caulobacteraceae bacterium]